LESNVRLLTTSFVPAFDSSRFKTSLSLFEGSIVINKTFLPVDAK